MDVENEKQRPGIRWHNTDEEALETLRQPITRTQTTGSQLSINVIPSRRTSIDLSTALPIQYRTV